MNFLEYSNRTQSNIIPKESFEDLVQEVFGVIASNLAKSLGPLGSSTMILDGMMTSSTKDGFGIFKSFRFHNRYKNMIYNLIKAPCTRLNNTVGDGTTTAIVLTHFLFEQYQGIRYMAEEDGKQVVRRANGRKNSLEAFYRMPRTLTQAWDEMVSELVEKIKTYAVPLSPEDYDTIFKLSYVTSNGNHDISQNIANTYKDAKSPVIKLKNSPTNKSYITPITGFEFPANLIDQGYVRNEDLSVEEKNIYVMIFDHKIEADIMQNFIIPVNEVLKTHNKKLLVIAPYYDAHLANTVLKQYMNHEYQKYQTLNLILAQYAIGKLDDHQLADLATVLRAVVIDQNIAHDILEVERFAAMPDGEKYEFITESMEESDHKYHRIIGTAATALLSCTNGSIFRVENIEEDDRYMDMLRVANKTLEDIKGQQELERASYSYEVAKAQARISQLKMENYIYYIGSDSALQTNILYDSIDDVVKCIRSAIKSGIVPGCQLSIIRACGDVKEDILKDNSLTDPNELEDYDKLCVSILEMIEDAVVQVYASVLEGPNGSGVIKLIPMWQHIDSTSPEAVKELYTRANEKRNEIIKESVEKNQVFDIEALTFSTGVITSAETDINVLMAASELIKLLISGNQCVFLDAEVNDSHDETIEAYV